MPVATEQYRGRIGQHYSRIQTRDAVPVHTRHNRVPPDEPRLCANIALVSATDVDALERGQPAQAGARRTLSVKCTTGKVVFTLFACCAAGTVLTMMAREGYFSGPQRDLPVKTEYFAQGKLEYFADNRMEFTLKERHPGYILDHEMQVNAARNATSS